MSCTTRVFLLVALIAAGGAAWMVTRQRQLTPAEQLEVLEARVGRREHHSEEVLLRGLQSVSHQALAAGDVQLAARALTTRGKLLVELGAAGRARDDFQLALQLLPKDLEIRRLAATAELAAGDHAAALRDLVALLRERPDYGPAWVQKGTVHVEIAQGLHTRCRDLLARSFARDTMSAAEPLLARLAAQDLADPARATTLLRVRELAMSREDELYARALALADDASRELALAREAYTRSFELELDPEAVASYIAILVDAGQLDHAVELGRVARRRPQVRAHLPTNGVLLRAQLERGDLRSAAAIAMDVTAAEAVSVELLLLACRAFYETRTFGGLVGENGAAIRLRQLSRDHERISDFYIGFVQGSGPEPRRGITNLRDFATSAAREPFPGARFAAWREIARLAQLVGDRFQEREALHAAVSLEPGRDGRLWRRLGELQAEGGNTSPALPLASLTHALRLLPRHAAQLLPSWRELGEQALAEEGIDLDIVFANLRGGDRTLPPRASRPYELFRLAELWLEAGEPSRVLFVTRRLHDVLPGFLPAIDLEIDALLALGRMRLCAEQVVRRAEAVGQDERTDELLARVPRQYFSSEQILRLMEAAPDRFGRRAIAIRQRAEGRPDLALETLLGGQSRDDDEARLMAGELLLEAGNTARAAGLLLAIDREAAVAVRMRRPALLASLATGRLERAYGLLADATADAAKHPAHVLELADVLLHAGEHELARDLLTPLDAPEGARSEALFLRLALCALLGDDHEAARAALARAEFYTASDAPEVGLLLANARAREWDAAARLARGLSAQELVASPREVLLALLEGETDRAVELAEEAAESRPRDTFAQLARALARVAAHLPPELPAHHGAHAGESARELVQGNETRPRDPRRTAALLLALETPPFAPLATLELRHLVEDDLGATWAGYLLARAERAAGDPAAARRTLEAVTRRDQGFVPAWDELVGLVEERLAPDHVEHQDVLARRRNALVALPDDDYEGALARAETFLATHRPESALTQAQRALELRPESQRAKALIAAALTGLGDPASAFAAWREACFDGPLAATREHAPEYLASLRAALDRQPPALLRSQVELAIDELAERLPDDPLVVLAQAELDLHTQTTRSSLGVARARARLEAFRERHAHRALEELRPGSASRWGELLARFDPRAALEFVELELRLDPARVDLRVLRARMLRAAGDPQAALSVLERLGRMVEDPRVELERAACLIGTGGQLQEVERHLERAVQLGGKGRATLEVELLRARSRLPSPPQQRARIVADLERIWRAREAPQVREGLVELGYLYTLHLLLGDPRDGGDEALDRSLAREIASELLPRTRDPYRASCLRALSGLAARPDASD